jgi:ABC-type enterochelin transport system substrate-binding protein
MVPNIFKYEDGYADIEDKLGFKISHKMNVTPSYNYLDYYDESREKLILNLFEKDFENFNYSTSLA